MLPAQRGNRPDEGRAGGSANFGKRGSSPLTVTFGDKPSLFARVIPSLFVRVISTATNVVQTWQI